MRFRVLLLAASLLACLPGRGAAQSLFLAPADTEDDRVRRLIAPPEARPLELEVRAFARGDTNVIALADGGRRHVSRRLFTGGDAYFDAFRNGEIALAHGMWRLRYASTEADLYEGNHDAAQLFLDSISDSIDPHAATRPVATMNRTAATRWRVDYSTPVRLASRKGALYLAVTYLRMQRVQLGDLTGDTTGNRFQGTLTFLSTLGLPPAETRSDGLGLDASLALPLSGRWRAAVTVENLLSRIWERGLQNIAADVATNAVEPDGDGFLHGVPLLQGRVSRENLVARARRRFEAGLACRQGGRDWLLVARQDGDWRVAAGVAARRGRDGQAWGLLWLSPFEWQAGLDSGNWRLEFGMSELQPGSARRATLGLALRVVLDRPRSAGARPGAPR